MRKLTTATLLVAAFAIQGASANTPGMRTPGERPVHSQFAITQPLHVNRLPAPPAIPYASQQGALQTIPATGAIVYSDAWSADNSPVGFYEIPTSGTSADFTLLSASSYAAGNAGALFFDGSYMVADAEVDYNTRTVSYYVLDADTYELTGMGVLSSSFMAYSMVQDPVTGNCYGSFYNTNTEKYYFGSINKTSFTTRTIKSHDESLRFNAMGATTDGKLYGITFAGDLYSIDKSSGNMTLVAATGIASRWQSSGAINPRNGKFYYATSCDQGSAFYEIDPATGDAAKVYDMPYNEEIVGLHFPAFATELSPDYPRDVTVTFDGSSLKGEISFTMPSTYVNGEEATGSAAYSVTVDFRPAASGTAAYGEKVTAQVEVESAGMHTFNITVSNDNGDSPRTTHNIFVGADTPQSVTDVKLTYDGGIASLTWEPARAVNGGYLENLTYKVTRADGTIAAEATTATTFSEECSIPDDGIMVLGYNVTASASGVTTTATPSNRITLGSVTPPYSNSLATEDKASHFTIINANNDKQTWEWDQRGFYSYYYNNSQKVGADDYLVLPAVRLAEGKVYTISFDAYGYESSRYTEKVALYVGDRCASDAFTTCLIEPVEIVGGESKSLSANFKAPASGIYYFAIHACSDADQFALYVDNVAVSAPIATTAPSMATEITATPDRNGALSATVNFTAPAVDLDGAPLADLEKVEVHSGTRLVATLTGEPGARMTCTDNEAIRGENSYTIIPFNSAGEGEYATVSVFVGFAAPERPETFTVRTGANDGAVEMQWSPVTTDVNGLQFGPSDITYTVVRYEYRDQVILAEGLTACEFSCQVMDATYEQELIQFAVFPINSYGEPGVGLSSEMIPVGAPDVLPFVESFAGGYLSHTFGMSYDGAEWWLSNEADMENNVPAQDGDDGFAILGSNDLKTSARLFTGRIDMSEAVAPILSFYYYVLSPENPKDMNTITVLANDGSGWTEAAAPFVLGNGEKYTWQQATVDLTPYAGKRIQIGLEGAINTFAYIFIDNLRIAESGSGSIDAAAASPTYIKGIAGAIEVNAPADAPVTITDISGRVIYTGAGSATVSIPTGIYVVRAGSVTAKIAVL